MMKHWVINYQKGDHAHARLARALRGRALRARDAEKILRFTRRNRARARCARGTQVFEYACAKVPRKNE